ncbi:hypothetical protein HJC99_03930 [Candidatus Saccharibacteria bacterium]|nr:hypothetical protein [Candidatus Saccharibacteria bacterium]
MANWFNDFESRPLVGKDKIPWLVTVEFEIQSKYFVDNLKRLPQPDSATDAQLLASSQHCNNLIGWVEQMRIMGYTGLPGVIEDVLADEFGNRQLLADLRQTYTSKWLDGKAGQHKIGENYFTVHQGKFYYSTIHGEWFEVRANTIFDISPIFSHKADIPTTALLTAHHEPTRYQQIYTAWRLAGNSGKMLSAQFSSKSGQTTPEDVLEDTIKKLHIIVEQPVALEAIEQATAGKPNYLEYLIKISCLVADFAEHRRQSGEHTRYLLRYCAMFHEAQILLDIVKHEPTSHDQIYLGRQSLSSSLRDAGHWYVAQELLLLSLQKYPQ